MKLKDFLGNKFKRNSQTISAPSSIDKSQFLGSPYNTSYFNYQPIPYASLRAKPPKSPEWLVDSLFAVGTINILGGDSGVGKSWLALHLALCIASGRMFLGKFAVHQGKVLLIDEENALDLIWRRLQKLELGMQLDDQELSISILENIGIRFDVDGHYRHLEDILATEQPNLVIVDSLVRMHGADENSATEMDKVFRRVKKLTQQFGSTFLFTHHSRKFSLASNRAGQMLRGSTDIRAFADSHIFMRGSGKQKTLEHDKSRWTPEQPKFKVLIRDTDDGVATTINYIGDVELKKTRKDQAMQLIVSRLEGGDKMSRKQILASRGNIGVNSIDKGLNQLEQDGIIQSKGNKGTTKIYWLIKK